MRETSTVDSATFPAGACSFNHRRFVLIGEASHGTYEFSREQARFNPRRLIDRYGFNTVESTTPAIGNRQSAIGNRQSATGEKHAREGW